MGELTVTIMKTEASYIFRFYLSSVCLISFVHRSFTIEQAPCQFLSELNGVIILTF